MTKPPVSELEAQWLTDLRSMREAIAELKLDQDNADVKAYGEDVLVNGEDLTGAWCSDDIWDLWSDEEEAEESSGYVNGAVEDLDAGGGSNVPYSRQWLSDRCSTVTAGNSRLNAEQLADQILALLASDLQGMLR